MSRGDGGRQRIKTAKGRSASSIKWIQRQLNDPYVRKAQAEGYRSRAAYKLIELDERFHFLKGAKRVIDLGIAPGGWTQVVRKVCPQALVVEPRYPTERATDGSQGALHEQVSPAEAFTRYFADRYAGFPDPAVLQAFQDLHDELTHAPA